MWKYAVLCDTKICISNNRSNLNVALIFLSSNNYKIFFVCLEIRALLIDNRTALLSLRHSILRLT